MGPAARAIRSLRANGDCEEGGQKLYHLRLPSRAEGIPEGILWHLLPSFPLAGAGAMRASCILGEAFPSARVLRALIGLPV